jgi:hypothetical protein
MENVNCVKVNESEKQLYDATPTWIECEEAVRSIKNGQDRFPAEFYNMFWTELKDEYFKSFLKGIECAMLPFSQSNAITIIYKKVIKMTLRTVDPQLNECRV